MKLFFKLIGWMFIAVFAMAFMPFVLVFYTIPCLILGKYK